jgi:hypothetical protein
MLSAASDAAFCTTYCTQRPITRLPLGQRAARTIGLAPSARGGKAHGRVGLAGFWGRGQTRVRQTPLLRRLNFLPRHHSRRRFVYLGNRRVAV